MACFVPEPKLIPQWISPIFPFAPSPWATFITMIFVSIAFTGIVIRGESFVRFENSSKVNLSEIVLTVLGVMLLQGLVKEPDRPSWAALAMTLLVVSLLLATAYGSSLASAMTIPRFKAPMDTVMELTTSGISWAVNHEFWLYSIINAEEPKILETQASKIHSYWRTDVVQQHFDIRTQLAVHSDNLVTHDPVKMTVGQVQGTFYILAIGLAISGLVFLKELYDAQKSTRQRKKEIEGY